MRDITRGLLSIVACCLCIMTKGEDSSSLNPAALRSTFQVAYVYSAKAVCRAESQDLKILAAVKSNCAGVETAKRSAKIVNGYGSGCRLD